MGTNKTQAIQKQSNPRTTKNTTMERPNQINTNICPTDARTYRTPKNKIRSFAQKCMGGILQKSCYVKKKHNTEK